MDQYRKYRPAIFVIIMITFFMPFLSVSCENQEIISVTGVGMMTETKIGSGFASETIPASPWVLMAGISAIVGLVTALKNKEKFSSAAGFAGAAFLLFFMSQVKNAAREAGTASEWVQVGIHLKSGYWLALLLSLAAGILFASAWQSGKQKPVTDVAPGSGEPMPPSTDPQINQPENRFCTNCGNSVAPQDVFCIGCGKRME